MEPTVRELDLCGTTYVARGVTRLQQERLATSPPRSDLGSRNSIRTSLLSRICSITTSIPSATVRRSPCDSYGGKLPHETRTMSFELELRSNPLHTMPIRLGTSYEGARVYGRLRSSVPVPRGWAHVFGELNEARLYVRCHAPQPQRQQLDLDRNDGPVVQHLIKPSRIEKPQEGGRAGGRAVICVWGAGWCVWGRDGGGEPGRSSRCIGAGSGLLRLCRLRCGSGHSTFQCYEMCTAQCNPIRISSDKKLQAAEPQNIVGQSWSKQRHCPSAMATSTHCVCRRLIAYKRLNGKAVARKLMP